MQRKAALYLLSFLVGLSVVAAGCAGEVPPAAGGELVTQGAAAVAGASKVTLCNLPRYTKQTTVRLCGYVTPGSDGSPVAWASFIVDGATSIPVVPGNGGFVDTSTSLSEGTHSIRLYAWSAADNLTIDEKPVTVDLTPPNLQVLSPTPADVLTSPLVNVTSSVADATPVRVQTQWVRSSTVDSGVGTVTHTVDLVSRGYNTLLVRATDAAGNTSESRITLYFCPSSDAACFTSAHWAPVIVSTSPSTIAPGSASVTLRVVASDPQSSPLSFSWAASVGALGVPTSGSTTSEVVWTPPACLLVGSATPTMTATVTNALGASASRSFTVTGVPLCNARVVTVASGYWFSATLSENGTVSTWGSNSNGELGDGTTTRRRSPALVPGLGGVTALVAGGYHAVALRQDGTVWTWGYNNWGQLGDGTTTSRRTPVQVPGLSGVTALAAATYSTFALRQDGTIWAWGYNGYGGLGDGTNTTRLSPVQVPSLNGITALAAGDMHTLALRQDGTVWAWGYNEQGELGDGTTTNRRIPAQVPGLSGITAVAAGSGQSLALRQDGTVWAWGLNFVGQLGDGTTTNRRSPVQVPGLSGVTALAAGDMHTLALRQDGTVWAWGYNDYGQLGDGTTTQRLSPVQVPGLSGVTALDAGYWHSLALRQDGTVWAWGINNSGQLGDGTSTNHSSPIKVPAI